MPSTVVELFAAADLSADGVVPWGTPVPERRPGVYAVALTEGPNAPGASHAQAPVSRERCEELLSVRSELLLDGRRPTAAELAERLARFWSADEPVLYIGRAGQPLRKRVGQYYRTPLGAKRPHAGSWWLRMLGDLPELWVHYTATPEFVSAERALSAFARGVPARSRAALHDRDRVAPFANLRTGTEAVKRQGVSGATGD